MVAPQPFAKAGVRTQFSSPSCARSRRRSRGRQPRQLTAVGGAVAEKELQPRPRLARHRAYVAGSRADRGITRRRVHQEEASISVDRGTTLAAYHPLAAVEAALLRRRSFTFERRARRPRARLTSGTFTVEHVGGVAELARHPLQHLRGLKIPEYTLKFAEKSYAPL